jgi:hypothetical protein
MGENFDPCLLAHVSAAWVTERLRRSGELEKGVSNI